MKLNQPVGNSLYAPLLIRVTLGGYLLLAGLDILESSPDAFIREVQGFQILPKQLSTLYGIMLPYIEVATGALLLLGLWTTLAAVLSALMLFSFVIALGLFPNDPNLFNKDVILMAAAVSLMYSGAGAWSVDRFRQSG